MNDDLIEFVARKMDPLAWVEYGDRNHREITMIHARNAIPAVIEFLAEEARTIHGPLYQIDAEAVPRWLLSHLPDPELPTLDGYTLLGRGKMDNLPVYQKDADSSLWIRAGNEMLPYTMTFDHTSGLGRVKT